MNSELVAIAHDNTCEGDSSFWYSDAMPYNGESFHDLVSKHPRFLGQQHQQPAAEYYNLSKSIKGFWVMDKERYDRIIDVDADLGNDGDTYQHNRSMKSVLKASSQNLEVDSETPKIEVSFIVIKDPTDNGWLTDEGAASAVMEFSETVKNGDLLKGAIVMMNETEDGELIEDADGPIAALKLRKIFP